MQKERHRGVYQSIAHGACTVFVRRLRLNDAQTKYQMSN